MNRRNSNLLAFIFVIALCFPALSYASSATYKLIDELTQMWLKETGELNTICAQGNQLNSDVFSFWNPVFASKRVEAFSKNTEEMRLYVGRPEEIDNDTISAFADAKEAALLRAMRKRCPDVW